MFADSLKLGRPESVQSGSALVVLGWPSPHGQRSIFVDSTHECLAREGQYIRTRAFIHAGSSGGPALNASLNVVGVASHNPRWSDDTLAPPDAGGEDKYLALIRTVERIALAAEDDAALASAASPANPSGPSADAPAGLTSLRWPVVTPKPDASTPDHALRPVPLRPFTLGVAELSTTALGLRVTLQPDGRGGSYSLRARAPSVDGLPHATVGEAAAVADASPRPLAGSLSPLCTLSLDSAARRAARVPPGATHFAFGSPVAADAPSPAVHDALGESFAAAGGFLYFTLQPASAAGATAAAEAGAACSYSLCGATAFTRSAGQGLRFDGPVPLQSRECVRTLTSQRRLSVPTLELLIGAGVKHFCCARRLREWR